MRLHDGTAGVHGAVGIWFPASGIQSLRKWHIGDLEGSMRKALAVSGIVLTAAWMAFFYMCFTIDNQKESVIILEEPIVGDPVAAEGITLQIASSLDNEIAHMGWSTRTENVHLLWNTEYTVGSGEGAESEFQFSARGIQREHVRKGKYISCVIRQGFGSANYVYADGTVSYEGISLESFLMPEILSAVAERTAYGEEKTESVMVSDYYEHYPIAEFGIHGASVEDKTSTFDGSSYQYLTDFFRIPPKDDMVEVMVKKDQSGYIMQVTLKIQKACGLLGASAFGEKGCYYVYCCTDEKGDYEDRGQNSGIFYIPYESQNQGRSIAVDWDQIRKVCGQPEGMIPVEFLLEEEKGQLFLVARGEKEFSLFVYQLEGEIPVLTGQIPLIQGSVGKLGEKEFPCFRRISMEDGGLLLTWQDNTFAFLVEEQGQYSLWYEGKFPVEGREEEIMDKMPAGEAGLRRFLEQKNYYASEGSYDARQRIQNGNDGFTAESACYFDGERLVLAAPVENDSVDIILSVFHEDGLAYCGMYRHSEVKGAYRWLAGKYVGPWRTKENGCVVLRFDHEL